MIPEPELVTPVAPRIVKSDDTESEYRSDTSVVEGSVGRKGEKEIRRRRRNRRDHLLLYHQMKVNH